MKRCLSAAGLFVSLNGHSTLPPKGGGFGPASALLQLIHISFTFATVTGLSQVYDSDPSFTSRQKTTSSTESLTSVPPNQNDISSPAERVIGSDTDPVPFSLRYNATRPSPFCSSRSVAVAPLADSGGLNDAETLPSVPFVTTTLVAESPTQYSGSSSCALWHGHCAVHENNLLYPSQVATTSQVCP